MLDQQQIYKKTSLRFRRVWDTKKKHTEFLIDVPKAWPRFWPIGRWSPFGEGIRGCLPVFCADSGTEKKDVDEHKSKNELQMCLRRPTLNQNGAKSDQP